MKHGVFNRFKYAGAVHALGGALPIKHKKNWKDPYYDTKNNYINFERKIASVRNTSLPIKPCPPEKRGTVFRIPI